MWTSWLCPGILKNQRMQINRALKRQEWYPANSGYEITEPPRVLWRVMSGINVNEGLNCTLCEG